MTMMDELIAQIGGLEPRVVEIFRSLSPRRREAWLTCGERMAAGMPHAEAEALMWRELAAAGEA